MRVRACGRHLRATLSPGTDWRVRFSLSPSPPVLRARPASGLARSALIRRRNPGCRGSSAERPLTNRGKGPQRAATAHPGRPALPALRLAGSFQADRASCSSMDLRLTRLSLRFDSNYWLVPALCVAVAVGLSYASQALDAHLSHNEPAWYLFRGGPESARSVLSAVVSSMLTLAGLVFSVTILVLQLASKPQFSPRALRTFLKDRPSQLALGIFVGTFVYALLGLRIVRGTSEGIERHVPSLSVWSRSSCPCSAWAPSSTPSHHVPGPSGRGHPHAHWTGDARLAGADVPGGPGRGHRGDSRFRSPRGAPQPGIPSAGKTPGCSSPWTRSGSYVRPGGPHHARPGADDGGLHPSWRPPLRSVGRWHVPRRGSSCRRRCPKSLPERTLHQDTAFGFRQRRGHRRARALPGINDSHHGRPRPSTSHHLLRRIVRQRYPLARAQG